VRTLLWILLAQTCGGIAPAITKLALAGLGPWSLVVVRQILGAGLLALVLWLRARHGTPPRAAPFSRGDLWRLLLLAWGGFALPQVLGNLGLELSTASHGALLIPLEPIGILLGGAFFLREPLTLPRVTAIVLGIAGATLIVLPGTSGRGEGDVRGDVLMALGHLSWAIYTLVAKQLLARHDALRVSLVGCALSPLPVLPWALAEPLDGERALAALGWILLLAFATTAVGTFAWNRALRHVRAGTMASFIFVQPLVGLAVGRLALGEPVGAQSLVGALLIVAGVTWAALRGDR
jgi:drug/metabolite transporter (DMT)-like permease